MKIKISCDSTCDLPKSLYEKYEILVFSLGVTLGERCYTDGVDLQSEQLFAEVERTGCLPKTSAVSIGTYQQGFSQWVEAGYQIIHIGLSSELSSNYQNACIAAQMTGSVYPVDSKSLTTGSGELVLKAVEWAEAGQTVEEIVAGLTELREHLEVSFILQTLDYLNKGGRCSALTALGANLLRLRPTITATEGKLLVSKKYRGTLEKTVADYVQDTLAGRTDIASGRIFITHAKVSTEVLQKAMAQVRQLQPLAEVLVAEAGSTICSHCGPACFCLTFVKEKS